jgi:hypothetical protein
VRPAPFTAALDEIKRRNPYWSAQLVVLVTIALDAVLPDKVTPGPFWLLPSFEVALLTGLTVASIDQRLPDVRRRQVGLTLIGIVSAVNAFSLAVLVHLLLRGKAEHGRDLIAAGSVLWLTNVLLFGLWYWELDRGGPLERARGATDTIDFLFPQMTEPRVAPEGWCPNLIDYLYVSLTNATAFSPTDAMPLTRLAKALMGAQAMVSLVTVGLVVARAVNILN